MKRKNDNLSDNDSATQLDENIARLLKQAGDSNKPSRTFTESLIANVLGELNRSVAAYERTRENILMKVGWLDKAVGWAAITAAACVGGLAFVVGALLKVNTCLAAVAVMTIFANWLNYLGGLIL